MEGRVSDLVFLSGDHPEANGRVAQHGDVEYPLRFPLEDGRILCVKLGQVGYEAFADMIRQMATDDALEEALRNHEPR